MIDVACPFCGAVCHDFEEHEWPNSYWFFFWCGTKYTHLDGKWTENLEVGKDCSIDFELDQFDHMIPVEVITDRFEKLAEQRRAEAKGLSTLDSIQFNEYEEAKLKFQKKFKPVK